MHVFGVDSQLITGGTFDVAAADDPVVGGGGWSRRQTLDGGDQMKGEADLLLDPGRNGESLPAAHVAKALA